MKQITALVAIVLCLLVAYQMHRDRLDNALKAKAQEEDLTVRKPLSEYLEPYRKELFAKIDERRPADLVPPLEVLRMKASDKRQHADAPTRAIAEAGVAALDQMIAVAQYRTEALRQILKINSAPVGALERQDSRNTATAFFKESALRRVEDGRLKQLTGLEQALTQLRQVEAQIAATYGREAVEDDYGQRRLPHSYVKAETDGTGNPLDREAYDRRQVIIPRAKNTENSGF